MDTGYLEDWLHNVASPLTSLKSPPPPPPSAQQIAHSWAQLRTCVQNGILESQHLAALKFLQECGRTLHVAEPQARLLLSILSSVTSVDAHALGQARSSAAILLSTWIRKNFKVLESHRANQATAKQSREILNLVVESTLKALEDCDKKRAFIGEAILLLGTLCAAAHIHDEARRICQEALTRECLQERHAIVQGRLQEALAGVGYAIVSSNGHYLAAIMRAVLLMWSSEQSIGQQAHKLESPPLKDGLMLLHLMEWCGSTLGLQQQTAAIANAQVVAEEFSEAIIHDKTSAAVKCAVVMGAAGLLRSFYRSALHRQNFPGAEPKWLNIRRSLEYVIASMTDNALQSQVTMVTEKIQENIHQDVPGLTSHLGHWLFESGLALVSASDRHWLQCAALAMARCSGFPPNFSILLCLTVTLLKDALPLASLYTAQLRDFLDISQESIGGQDKMSQSKQECQFSIAQKELGFHVRGILFQEAGAISRAVCEQYQSANKGHQLLMEALLWKYSRNLYQSHRLFVALLQRSMLDPTNPVSSSLDPEDEALKKILEAIFLSVVMFFSFAVKERNRPGVGREQCADVEFRAKGQIAVQVLDSLSCVEFFRKVQVPEYGVMVQSCVSWVSASASASTALVHMLPSYDDVLHYPGRTFPTYSWAEDKVQTARVLFYFRVLPSCLDHLPASIFLNGVAPLMFLYIQHPTKNVAQASHALFSAFISCNSDSQLSEDSQNSKENSRNSIKEQLVVFYIQRALETFPGFTPFDGLVSGVGAIVRHLPSGSPATVYCIDCLSEKVNELYAEESINIGGHLGEQLELGASKSSQGPRILQARADKLEAPKKLQTLLLHLILAVDVQVLPHLLKVVARLILGLPDPLRMAALEEAFDILAGTDDFTRKPILVPWLQSLSYLCAKSDDRGKLGGVRDTKIQEKNSSQNGDVPACTGVAQNDGAINLNPSSGYEERRYRTGSFRADQVSLPWESRSRL